MRPQIYLAQGDDSWILFIGMAIALLLLWVSVWLFLKTRRFKKSAIEVEATYVGAENEFSTIDQASSKYGVLEFTTLKGEIEQYRSMIGFPGKYRANGKKAPVLYNPEDPKEARLNHPLELVYPWVFFALLGGGIFAVNMILLLLDRLGILNV